MKLMSLPQMAVTSREGWPELIAEHPSVGRTFAFIVLPLALLPPAMLYFAGTHYGDELVPGFAAKPWAVLAAVFFFAEILTYIWMGWFIRQVAASYRVALDARDAYLLAALTPIPMWLSSLGLLVPNLLFCAVIALLGLAAACGMTYQGIHALCRRRESEAAPAIVHTVLGAGLAAWGILLAITLPV